MDDSILDPQNRQDFPDDFNRPQTDRMAWVKAHFLPVIAGVMLLVLVVVAALWFFRDKREVVPENPNVILDIKGSENTTSGNETEFRVVYTNGENADLTGLTLEVFYPSNFKFASSDPKPSSSNAQRFDLPILRQGQSAEVKIRGKINGATGEEKEFRAKLTFRLSNFTSEFSVETNHKTVLQAPELEMEITGPIDVTNGQNTTFTVNYKSVSTREFDATGIRVQYPEGFKFISSNPAPSKDNNYWLLGKLAPGGQGVIEITGNFIGDPGTEVQVAAELGIVLNNSLAPQILSSARFKVQPSTLSLTQEVSPDQVTKLGENLQFTLEYANYGSVGQSNVVITTVLEGASLDMQKIRANGGIVTGNTISWKSATLSNLSLLSPNQKGQVTFSVPMKSTVATNLKNQTIKSTTSIYSDQITSPVRGEEVELKLASELNMIVSGNYVSGAMPMKVGEATTFNINILLTNLSNDLSETTMIASMPLQASSWINVVTPESEKSKVTFDNNASKIKWTIGNLDAFVGRYSPAKTVSFQLQVTPSESDRGKTITLLRNIQTTAIDTFTTLNIQSTQLHQLTVSDLSDDVIDAKGSTVQ